MGSNLNDTMPLGDAGDVGATQNTETNLELLLDRLALEANRGELSSVVGTMLEAEELLPEEDRESRVKLLLAVARWAVQDGEHVLAGDCLNKSLSLATPDMWQWTAEALILQGWSLLMQNEQDKSLTTLLRAMKLLRYNDGGEPRLLFPLYYCLAGAYAQEPAKSLCYCLYAGKTALSQLHEDGESNALRCYIRVAELGRECGVSPEQICVFLSEAIDGLCAARKHGMPLGMLYSRRGMLLYDMGSYFEEYEDYTRAIECFRDMDSAEERRSLSGIYINRAETAGRLYGLYEGEKDLRQAELLLLHGIDEKQYRRLFRSSPLLSHSPYGGLLSPLNSAGVPSGQLARLYYEWGRTIEEYGDESDNTTIRAERKYTQALLCAEAAQRETDSAPELYVSILECLGNTAYQRGKPAEAHRFYHRTAAALKRLPDSDMKTLLSSRLHQRRSDCYAMEGNLREEFREIELAILQQENLREKGCPVDMLQAGECLRAGQLCDELGHQTQAEEYYQMAVRLYEGETLPGQQESLANAYYRLGNLMAEREEHLYTRAMEHYFKAISLLEELRPDAEIREALTVVYRTRGELYANMHEFSSARKDFVHAAALQSGLDADTAER